MVFHLLPPRDLKAVVLVCRWWREVGEAPALWVWVCIRVKGENHGYIKEFLDSRRLQAVRRIEVREEVEVSEELLQAVVRHPGLKEMRVQSTDLSAVDPELLAQAVTQLEEVVHTRLTPQQVTAICTAMTGNSPLKALGLTDNNLSSVHPELLAQAVTQLEEVDLVNTDLTPQQVKAIFAALDTSCKMKILKIQNNNLSSVDPDVLARGVNKPETVDMCGTDLTEQQMTKILTRSLLITNLKKLDIEDNGEVDDELCRQATQVIEELFIDLYVSDIEDEESDD